MVLSHLYGFTAMIEVFENQRQTLQLLESQAASLVPYRRPFTPPTVRQVLLDDSVDFGYAMAY